MSTFKLHEVQDSTSATAGADITILQSTVVHSTYRKEIQFRTALYRQTLASVNVDIVCSVQLDLFLAYKNEHHVWSTHPSARPSVLGFLENRYISYSGKLSYIHVCTVKTRHENRENVGSISVPLHMVHHLQSHC